MKAVSIVGARPQFIKCAAVSRKLRKTATEVLVHTGQHYDDNMSEVFFRELEITNPDYDLGVGSGSPGTSTGEMWKRVEAVLLKERPEWVLVYGDTNSTLAGALAAAKLGFPLAHVEAGLRSGNKRMPEEINRVLTDHLSDLLFCPTQGGVQNLEREGILKGVHLVGDVMYDALLHYGSRAAERSEVLVKLGIKPKNYALATVHRAENTDDSERLSSIFRALEEIAARLLPVILPLHPRTKKEIDRLGLSFKHLQIIEPVSYLSMLLLEKQASVILTDSGGMQKEAYFFQVPCLTLREETEWTETVEAGWNVLVGSEPERIIQAVRGAKPGSPAPWPYGEGNAAQKIVETLIRQPSCAHESNP